MQVTVAKSAGFCFGVRRAVDMAQSLAREAEGDIYTLGPIIHNEEVVEELKQRGVLVLSSVQEAAVLTGGTIIICSHGVGRDVIRQLSEYRDDKGRQRFRVEDATCPFVKKVHRTVEEKSAEGYRILLIGDREHPEVQGSIGWSKTPVIVTDNEEAYFTLSSSLPARAISHPLSS